MTAEEAIAYIHAGQYSGEKHGLDNTREMLARLGLDITRVPAIHVAGTNGKGSTCAMLESMLRAQGYRTGLYTSPFLQTYQERIRLNHEPISDALLVAGVETIREAAERPPRVRLTAFEAGTVLAFYAFLHAPVDVMVLEVGMGGRLDPTNVVTPLVSVIAALGMDHMQYLGDTLAQIATEKAGIVKPGVPLVLHPCENQALQAVAERCRALDAPLYVTFPLEAGNADAYGETIYLYGYETRLPLPGAHQRNNAALAVRALELANTRGLHVSREHLLAGLSRCVWPARLEWVGQVLIDGAHNPQAARVLCEFLHTQVADRRIVLLTGIMRDKLVPDLVSVFAGMADEVVATPVQTPRAAAPADVQAMFMQYHSCVTAAPTLADALSMAKAAAGADGVVVVAGSLYLAGEMRTLLGLCP